MWTPLIQATLGLTQAVMLGKQSAVGRPAQPVAQVAIYVFLASDEASDVTGQIYEATGGQIARLKAADHILLHRSRARSREHPFHLENIGRVNSRLAHPANLAHKGQNTVWPLRWRMISDASGKIRLPLSSTGLSSPTATRTRRGETGCTTRWKPTGCRDALSGPPTPGGKVPARLFPVFRDREELPTSSELGGNLRGAIEQSRCLVVICSPRAAASRWVNEEIRSFQRLGRANRIFTLIVAGEPNASDGKLGFAPEMECFRRPCASWWMPTAN